jgi:hypothetical protein
MYLKKPKTMLQLIIDVQNVLIYYAQSEEDGPVGFVATDSGKIAVRFRMSQSVKICDNLLSAFGYILNFKVDPWNIALPPHTNATPAVTPDLSPAALCRYRVNIATRYERKISDPNRRHRFHRQKPGRP